MKSIRGRLIMVGEPHAQKGSDGKDIKKVYRENDSTMFLILLQAEMLRFLCVIPVVTIFVVSQGVLSW